jgi:hypothetical protein
MNNFARNYFIEYKDQIPNIQGRLRHYARILQRNLIKNET